MRIFIILCLLFLVGCSGSTRMGNGLTASWFANPFVPGVTVVRDAQGNIVGFASDHGALATFGPSAVQAVGHVAAANTFGSNLKPDHDDTGVIIGDTVIDNTVTSTATGGTARGGDGGAVTGGVAPTPPTFPVNPPRNADRECRYREND